MKIVIKSSSEHAELEISYSGPMHIAIRSAKHDGSSAFTHGKDVNRLLELPSFDVLMKHEGAIKPIFFMFVDGGPDENPRFPNTIAVAIARFKKFNLDAYVVMTHAPGMSAHNYVERRMAPLSKELAGVVLPYDSFGSHLDASGRITDDDLEKMNFKKAGQVLAEIWSNMVVDDYEITAEYIENEAIEVPAMDEGWMALHCRISQYSLMIVKCASVDCCGGFRTSWMQVFPNRFFPAPFPVHKSTAGPLIPEPAEIKPSDKFLPLWQRLTVNSGLKSVAASKFSEVPMISTVPVFMAM